MAMFHTFYRTFSTVLLHAPALHDFRITECARAKISRHSEMVASQFVVEKKSLLRVFFFINLII